MSDKLQFVVNARARRRQEDVCFKLVRDCYADIGLIPPFSPLEKGRGRGASWGGSILQALSPALSQRERESGWAAKFVGYYGCHILCSKRTETTMNVESLNLSTSRGATTAYVAHPPTKVDTGVILIQEWWGINDHIRDLAGRYAKEGYLCVAPDLYGGRVATDTAEASALMQALAIDDGLETIRKAMAAAAEAYQIRRFAITGYCMGGTFALRAACEMPELKAAAPFYGDIPEESVLARLRVPTLFIAGKRDAWINPAKVNTLKEIAAKHNLPVEVVSYDADHAFFNDTRPQVYNPEAAADAWRRVLEHFGKHLAKGADAAGY
jgi:carboxymethylenebutenolidase